MIIIFIIFFLGQSFATFKSCNSSIKSENYICKVTTEKYWKNVVPSDSLPLRVTPIIKINDVTNIDEIKHSVTIYLSLEMKWHDSKLSIKNFLNSTKPMLVSYNC